MVALIDPLQNRSVGIAVVLAWTDTMSLPVSRLSTGIRGNGSYIDAAVSVLETALLAEH